MFDLGVGRSHILQHGKSIRLLPSGRPDLSLPCAGEGIQFRLALRATFVKPRSNSLDDEAPWEP